MRFTVAHEARRTEPIPEVVMKRLLMVVLVAAVALGAASPNAHAVGVMASWWKLDDADEDGFGFGLRQKTSFTPLFAIDTRASWIGFSDSDLNMFPLEAAGEVSLGLFYGGIGLGYYIFDADNVDLDNNFGWFLVGGIEVALAKVGVFGEIKWTQLETDFNDVDPNLDDVPTSLNADGIGFNLGVTLPF
jgi:opacity protein-like surface antigen